ncbi:MAG: alpha/beta fold hydrolase [Sediminibacterium magnilacihabitans]|jgi:acyl transferase domain-containing protein/pimeloyl-ACP methyl ester carboxylesterase/acyl carrier protein/NADP-dependent 3-hydroxy acid dehydrogenase YdfG|nr:alpha/beta fold hydrolase [Sediminibacterium magnilacihabitans]PQV59458.1 ketoacyl-synthetase-like protein [Sediminibacterium magnilacihabitans]
MSLHEQTEALLKKVIAEETKLQVSSIKSDEGFESYGIESVLIVSITQYLENFFGPLSKTLFFEYKSINELVDYFVVNHGNDLQRIFASVEASPLQPRPTLKEKPRAVAFAEEPTQELIKPADLEQIPNALPKTDVAIIGISGRFPKAGNMQEFWENLKNGKDCISEIPGELWDYQEFFDPVRGRDGKSYSKWGGFMDDIDKFDPLFFKMSNLEAESIDPQERLFLQTVYHTLNDAGYTKESLQGSRVGVYVGIMWTQYQLYGVEKANAGSSYASIANRVSYSFDFNGPSIGLDTMCSSSLTTVHLACESLIRGETDMAIAGGVNITVHPNKYLFLSKTGFASTDGRCRSFGAGGDGYVPGDGVGALLLKPLAKAVSDGDYIYGIVKSTAINHGGKTSGYTVPNPKAQSKLIADGLHKANIDPRTISYFETHGTGTALGDPIELRGLTTAFSDTTDANFCSIGSVKSNIGHLESAAGFAGIAKVLMQMKHRQIAPSLHASTLNPNLDFTNTPFFVQQELDAWKNPILKQNGNQKVIPLRAGVSSFGAGGANGFVLLEEFTETRLSSGSREDGFIIPLSARNKERLKACVQEIHDFLEWELRAVKDKKEQVSQVTINSVTDEVLAITAEVLNVNVALLEIDDHFQDYDFNEANYRLLNTRLKQVFDVSLPPSISSSFDTPIALSKYIFQQLTGGSVSQPYMAIGRIAYTLQMGREHMEERVAVVASSTVELLEQLRSFLHEEKDMEVFSGNVALLKGEKGIDESFINTLIKGKKYQKLAGVWCKGVSIDWKKFYIGDEPVKIPLPGYSFAKEHCWVTDPTPFSYDKRKRLHPMVHSIDTLSTLNGGLTYQTVFSSADRVVTDHSTNDHLVFNVGAAIATLCAAAGVTKQGLIKMENIQCEELSVGSGLTVRIQVSSQGNTMNFDLKPDNHTTVAKTQVTYADEVQLPKKDITQIQNEYEKFAAGDLFYDELDQKGNRYGPYFRIFRQVAFSSSGAFGYYNLSIATPDRGAAHPGIWQGIFQLIAFVGNVPTARCHIRLVTMDGTPSQQGYIQVIKNVDDSWTAFVINEKGKVSVCAEEVATAKNELHALERFFYKPLWRAHSRVNDLPVQNNHVPKNILIVYPQSANEIKEQIKEQIKGALNYCNFYEIILGDKTQVLSAKSWEVSIDQTESITACLKYILDPKEIYFLGGIQELKEETDARYLDHMQRQGVVALMHLVKGIHENLKGNAITLKVVTNNLYSISDKEKIFPYAACVPGFAKAISKEYPQITTQMVDIDLSMPAGTDVVENITAQWHGLREWVIRDGDCYERKIIAAPVPPVKQTSFRSKGNYLVVGGSGNVGFKLSCHLAEQYGANIIWTGRNAMNDNIREKQAQIEQLGGKLFYHQVNIENLAVFNKCVDEISKDLGEINGVFHSAMAFEFSRISQLSDQTLNEMLKAKVQGSMTLLQTFGKRSPDFIMYFSSGEAFVGNIGWSAYAAACNFKDTLALYMEQLVSFPVHVVNWGFWEGNNRGNEAILRAKGIHPITAKQGMEVIERVAASNVTQTLALNVEDSVLQLMGVEPTSGNPPASMIKEEKPELQKPFVGGLTTETDCMTTSAPSEISHQMICALLVGVLSDVLKIDSDKIDVEADLANYGVDSLIVINIHKAIEEKLGTLPATLMLDFPTISEIASHLQENYKAAVSRAFLHDTKETEGASDESASNEPAPVQSSSDETSQLQTDPNGRFNVLRILPEEEMDHFLENYGAMFREGTLNTTSEGKLYTSFPQHFSYGKLVQMLVTTSNGKKVEVILAGKGSPILFMPPVALTAPVWYNQFMCMAREHCVVVIHTPGYGLSETIKESNTKGVASVFAEIVQMLFPNQTVHLVASCFGAIAAQYLASHHAEKIASLTLVGGFYDNIGLPDIQPEKLTIDELFAMVQTVSGSLKADFDNVLAHLTDSVEDEPRRKQVQRFSELLLSSQCANPLVAMKYLSEMLTLSTLPWLPSVGAPTLCIYGDYDTVVDPSASKVLHENIKHSKLVEIKGAGHYPFLTHDDYFNEILNHFLDEHDMVITNNEEKTILLKA